MHCGFGLEGFGSLAPVSDWAKSVRDRPAVFRWAGTLPAEAFIGRFVSGIAILGLFEASRDYQLSVREAIAVSFQAVGSSPICRAICALRFRISSIRFSIFAGVSRFL